MNRTIVYTFCLVALLLTACHKDEPDAVLEYPIMTELQTMSQKVLWLDKEAVDHSKYLNTQHFIVNDPSQLPDDKIFGTDDFRHFDIDFSTRSLLISYMVIPGVYYGHKYTWMYDNTQKQYQLYTTYYTYPEGEEDTKSEVFSYIRTAVLVKKISEDANLAVYYSLL